MNIIPAMLAGLTLALAGCAASQSGDRLPAPVVTAVPASMDCLLVCTTNALPGCAAETTELQNAVITGLRETELFAQVIAGEPAQPPAGAVKVRLGIQKIVRVTDDSRAWFGGLAGRARVTVAVAVTDQGSGKVFATYFVEGQTGAAAKSGTTEEAVQRAAAQVVARLVKLNSQGAQTLQ